MANEENLIPVTELTESEARELSKRGGIASGVARREKSKEGAMEIINRKVKDLIPYDKNPRKNDEAVKYVKASIEQFGFKVPIVIDAQGVIVAGHTRLKAAKELGMKEVPCIVADDLTPEQIKAYRLADNMTASKSEWDVELLNTELLDLEANFDMADFGFEIYPPTGEVSDDDFDADAVADAIIEPVTKLGDIWTLGRHRLMCGDSTDKATVGRLMDGAKADMSFTDPPYGIAIVKGNKIGGGGATHFGKAGGESVVNANVYSPIIGDESTDTARNAYELMVDNSDNQIIFGGNYFTDFLPPKSCWCVWDKQNTGTYFADVEMAWTSFDKGAKLYKWLWSGLCRKGERKYELNKRVHPTQKPVGMIAAILSDFTDNGNTILDLFGGSGSTLIACEQLNRTCYMMELDPKYCDVIIKRWETLTGDKAVLLNG